MMSTGNNLGCNKFREILFEKANKVPPFYLACHLEKEQNAVFNSLTINQLKIIRYISTQNRIKGLNYLHITIISHEREITNPLSNKSQRRKPKKGNNKCRTRQKPTTTATP